MQDRGEGKDFRDVRHERLPMTQGRVVIIPFLLGKLTPDGKVIEPDIDAILAKWLERHPEFRGPARDFQVIRTQTCMVDGVATTLIRVTAESSDDLAGYDPATDADL